MAPGWTSRVLVVLACSLIVYSFLTVGVGNQDTVPIKDEANSENPRMVFMVIDALRLSFLTGKDSPMKFTRSSITTSSAQLYDAYARMPTVTLPRITAYITGSLPSFGTILTNLATDEIKVDNWVSRLKNNGKRVNFFGDDTWVRLLPGQFEQSDGVTSFFVNDYTEVDNNVTRHLDEELKSESWDVMILHYLGLDHVGHSLGGTSPKIDKKLKEMDGIIEKISSILNESSEKDTFFIVCGDHGMTTEGSHGGASPDETRVPVVIWKSGTKPQKSSDKLLSSPSRIEQIDVSATIFEIFGFKSPEESYGISFASQFFNQSKNLKNLEEQHKHFSKLVKKKQIPISEPCGNGKCDYSNKFTQNFLKKWFRTIQEYLIVTASDIPNTELAISVSILIMATVLSTAVWNTEFSWTTPIPFLVNGICFASSFIEEEHEVWYFLGCTVLAIRIFRGFQTGKFKHFKLIRLAILHRVAYGFMQNARRRWSMDPKLLPESFFPTVLDFNVNDLNSIFKSDPIIVIALSYFLWTICSDFKQFSVLPILSHFLRVFELNLYNASYTLFLRFLILPITYFMGSGMKSVLLFSLSIVPSPQLLLVLIIYQIGELSRKLKLGETENVILCMCSFFYMGNSNSLSTLSLTSAYTGLLNYSPVLVGFQLILYTFTGPIAFMCGLKSKTSFLHLQYSFRISSLVMSLICLNVFQHHLFVWSVYSPKVVYDLAHVIFFSVVSFFI